MIHRAKYKVTGDEDYELDLESTLMLKVFIQFSELKWKSVKELAEKHRNFQEFFNFPPNERIILEGACFCESDEGNMFVSQNYISFAGTDIKVPFSSSFFTR